MRTDILERKEDILRWIEENQSKAFICRELRCKPETLNSYLDKMGIVYAGNPGGKGIKDGVGYKTAEEYIKNINVKSYILKQKLIKEGIKEPKCEICGLIEWNGKPIPLELHHIDCNHYNNELNNLQILCPNCHAQQSGNSGANNGFYQQLAEEEKQNKNKVKKESTQKTKKLCPICKKKMIWLNSKMCEECSHLKSRKVERPDRETLKQLIRTIPFLQIGKEYGVTDNTIRKWCDSYNLPRKVSEIKKYSNEEWNKI